MKNNNLTSSSLDEKDNALYKLFIQSLKDIYWAEQALVKAIPKMIKKSTSTELSQALQTHLNETEQQVKKVERVFDICNEAANAKKCKGINGIIEEAEEIIDEMEEGPMRDACIIGSAQKVEHYEIASYGTLKTYAKILELDEAVRLLDEILEEEKEADENLTAIAEASINTEAAAEKTRNT